MSGSSTNRNRGETTVDRSRRSRIRCWPRRRRRGWRISQIWNTHWHPDHTGGNAAIKAATGCSSPGRPPRRRAFPTLDRRSSRGRPGAASARSKRRCSRSRRTPPATSPIICRTSGVIFVGDTLFAMGCGRLFEGSAAQMYANLQRLAGLPDETRVYCAPRIYAVERPLRADRRARQRGAGRADGEVEAVRAAGEATVPTTIALERATNPFMRAPDVEEFARRRAAKDGFRA